MRRSRPFPIQAESPADFYDQIQDVPVNVLFHWSANSPWQRKWFTWNPYLAEVARRIEVLEAKVADLEGKLNG